MNPLDLVLRDLIDSLLGENLYGAADELDVDTAGVPGTAVADGECWCDIPIVVGSLVFRCRDGGPLQRYRLSRAPVWHVGDTVRELTPAEVLTLLADRSRPEREVAADAADRDHPGHDVVAADLRTAVEHAEVTRAGWSALAERAPAQGGVLTGERLAATRNRPFHPTARAVSGWSAAELSEYGPMRQDPLALCWVAVRRDRLRHGEDTASEGIAELLLGQSDRDRLAESMRKSGVEEDGYQSVPVHPWQFDRVLPSAWAEEIAAREIVPLDCRIGGFHPTASLRTLTTAPETTRHVKLPLGAEGSHVATLGAARLLPPRYLDNGDKAQRTLRWLLDADPMLADRVTICDERTWCGWHAEADDEFSDRPGQLAAQVRRYPTDILSPGAIVLPMAALAAHEWHHIAPALRIDDPVGFFRDLATDFCAMTFGFLGHGVLPELHGQNVVVRLPTGAPEPYAPPEPAAPPEPGAPMPGAHGPAAPPRFVLRDHDTVRICPQWLENTPDPGYRIKPGARQSLRLDAPETLIGYAQTLGFQVNLYGIADAIARHYQLDERVLWHALADAVTTGIDTVSVPDQVRDTLRSVLLDAPEWPSRQVLGPSLRAGRTSGVSMPAATGSVPNPLCRAAVHP